MRLAKALVLLLAWPVAGMAREVGEVDTVFKWFGPNHKIVVEAFDDPKVEGVTCYLSRARTGRHQGRARACGRSRRSLDCLPAGWPDSHE